MMGSWYARLENKEGDYMEVWSDADSKREAIQLADRQNKLLSKSYSRPLYRLTELRDLGKRSLLDRLLRRK